jgi:phospholipid/cholesterol/gamma-HCH transport system substrate-binding protein
MSKRTIELLVGLFMLVGLGALLILALRVSGLNEVYSRESGYFINVEFSNIAGLKLRSRVSIAGVAIGRVKEISFDKNSYAARVTLWIKSSIDNLPEDSKASILTAGFLGDNYIGISPGYSTNYLKDGESIPLENTHSGIILEELISKFVAGQASEKK